MLNIINMVPKGDVIKQILQLKVRQDEMIAGDNKALTDL